MNFLIRILICAFLLSAFLAGGQAMAQTQRSPAPLNLPFDPLKLNGTKLTGNIEVDAKAIWQKIVEAKSEDLEYASKMAAAANTSASAVRKQCWDAILVVNKQANGQNVKDASGNPIPKPDPDFFTQVETAAEIIDNLSPQGALYTSCAGAAQLAKANVVQFISAAVAGAVGLAKLSPIPGL